MREVIGENLLRWLPGDAGAVAAGVLIGGGEWLSWGARQDLARVGLLHVVAASGYNVTVVAGWMMTGAVRTVGRRWGIYLAMAGVVFYLWLAGWSASVVRAGVMAVMVLVAQAVGRKTEAGWLLVLTAVGMLALKPEYIKDVGWQLSMAATAGLLWIKPAIDRVWSGWGWWGEDLRTSLAAQVATVPIILHYFGNVSAAAPLVNAAVLWTIPVTMQIGAVAVAAGLVWRGFGQLVALLAWPFLAWFLGVASWVADQPWGGWEVGKMGWGWAAAYYLCVVLVIYDKRQT